MPLSVKYALHRTAELFLRLLSLFFLMAAFRHAAHADPITAIGAGVSGITSLLGGIFGSKAANKAADTQAVNAKRVSDLIGVATGNAQSGLEASKFDAERLLNAGVSEGSQAIGAGIGGANQTLRDIFAGESGNLNPYLGAGQQGIAQLLAATSPGGTLAGQFQAPTAEQAREQPGYQFAMDEGLKALQRSAAAGGSLRGGGTLKAITQYAQGLADTNYQNVFNNALTGFNTNRNATLQNLSALTGLGEFGTSAYNRAAENSGNQQAGNVFSGNMSLAQLYNNAADRNAANSFNTGVQQGNWGLQGANLQGAALTGGANAQAAGTVGSANAWQNALGGIGNAAGFFGLSQLMKPQSPQVYGGMPAGYSQPSVAGMAGTPAWNPNAWSGPGLPGGFY